MNYRYINDISRNRIISMAYWEIFQNQNLNFDDSILITNVYPSNNKLYGIYGDTFSINSLFLNIPEKADVWRGGYSSSTPTGVIMDGRTSVLFCCIPTSFYKIFKDTLMSTIIIELRKLGINALKESNDIKIDINGVKKKCGGTISRKGENFSVLGLFISFVVPYDELQSNFKIDTIKFDNKEFINFTDLLIGLEELGIYFDSDFINICISSCMNILGLEYNLDGLTEMEKETFDTLKSWVTDEKWIIEGVKSEYS